MLAAIPFDGAHSYLDAGGRCPESQAGRRGREHTRSAKQQSCRVAPAVGVVCSFLKSSLTAAAKLLTRDEARRFAVNIAKLPALLTPPFDRARRDSTVVSASPKPRPYFLYDVRSWSIRTFHPDHAGSD
jgi:hypothetical protein